jgi:hypothetical protein
MGLELSCLHVANTKLIIEPDMRSLGFMTTDYISAHEEQSEPRRATFNVFSGASAEHAYTQIIQSLQENIEVI